MPTEASADELGQILEVLEDHRVVSNDGTALPPNTTLPTSRTSPRS